MNIGSFDWLEAEIASVKTRKFFDVAGAGDLSAESRSLPISYRNFAARFGHAKLYKQHAGYAIGVYVPPKVAIAKTGESLLCIGHYLDRTAYFKEELLEGDAESPVFESYGPALRKVGECFAEWLHARAQAVRKTIGVRRWKDIVSGPPPFSPRELAILEARKAYRWRVVGTTPDGDVEFDVYNGSPMVLPFLSVGARSRLGDIEGRVKLSVGQLEPGASQTIRHSCYKGHIDRRHLELFDLPDPSPEERDAYWEFKKA